MNEKERDERGERGKRKEQRLGKFSHRGGEKLCKSTIRYRVVLKFSDGPKRRFHKRNLESTVAGEIEGAEFCFRSEWSIGVELHGKAVSDGSSFPKGT